MKALRNIPGLVCSKRLGGRANQGEADITGCYKSVRFEIEVKRPGGVATDLQMQQLKKWASAGAVTGIAYSVQDALDIVNKINN